MHVTIEFLTLKLVKHKKRLSAIGFTVGLVALNGSSFADPSSTEVMARPGIHLSEAPSGRMIVDPFNSACEGDTDELFKLAGSGCNLNARTTNGLTPLMFANDEGGIVLLSCGVDPLCRDAFGRTALHHAAARGNVLLARALYSRGCDINLRDKLGNTPLILNVIGCTWKGQLRPLGDPDSPEYGLFLHGSSRRGEMLRWLVSNGADVNDRTRNGRTPLMLALERRSSVRESYLPELLALRPNLALQDKDGITALMLAAQLDAETVRALIKYGAIVNTSDNRGWTALMYAEEAGNLGAFNALIEFGAQIDPAVGAADAGTKGLTPLIVAIRAEDLEMVKTLIAAGANAERADSSGHTPLSYAKQLDIKQYLLRILTKKPVIRNTQ